MNVPNRFERIAEDHSASPDNRLLIRRDIHLWLAGMVAFTGCSMKPTLVEGDLVEVRPYKQNMVKIGDIIYYQLPTASKMNATIHRVVRITPQGVIARGDHNSHDDADPIPFEFIFGQVTAVWRGSRRRKLAGGYKGVAYCKFHQSLLVCGRVFLPILRPFYRMLVRSEIIAGCLPWRFQPKIVEFSDGDKTHLQFVWRKRVIGVFDQDAGRWKISPPFHLFLSGKTLFPKERLKDKGITTDDNNSIR